MPCSPQIGAEKRAELWEKSEKEEGFSHYDAEWCYTVVDVIDEETDNVIYAFLWE